MNDTKQFTISLARLDALRKQIPTSVDESTVKDYHSIVDALEAASGEALGGFRIPDNEIKARVLSMRPTSYSGHPGYVKHSERKECDRGYFKRQVEGLWQYVQTIQTTDAPQPEQHNDYWSMSDNELELLAIKYNISPVSRVGEHLEHWFIDRERIIDALTKRDKALQAGTTIPHTSYSVNVEQMIGSAIQQGTQDSNVTANFKAKEREIRALLSEVDSSVDKLGLSPEDNAQLRVDIETINVQLSAATPKSSVISECLRSVKAILEHAAGHALAVSFLSYMTNIGI